MAPRIVVSRQLPEPALELLRGAGDVWLLAARPPAGHAGAARGDRRCGRRRHAAARPRRRRVPRRGRARRCGSSPNVAVGYDNIDVAACAARGVMVTNTPGVLTDATADIAMALILMATRRLGEGERLIRAGGTWSWSMFFHLGTGIQGKTLGIVGLGQIGSATARRARAFGMEIAYSGPAAGRRGASRPSSTPSPAARRAARDGRRRLAPLPADDETRHLIGARELALMKPTAFLVNTTRGPGRRRGGARRRRSRDGHDRRCRARRLRARARGRTRACSSSRTSCSSRTSARRRSRRAPRWACSPPGTSSRCSPASCRSRRSPVDAPSGVRPHLVHRPSADDTTWGQTPGTVIQRGRRPSRPCAPACCRSSRRPARPRARASAGRSRPSRPATSRSGTRRRG